MCACCAILSQFSGWPWVRYAHKFRNVRDVRGGVRPLGRPRVPLLEEDAAPPFPRHGILSGPARGLAACNTGSPLYSIAAVGPQYNSGLFYLFLLLLLRLLGGVHCQCNSALFRLHRDIQLRAVGVTWVAEIRDGDFPLGGTGF